MYNKYAKRTMKRVLKVIKVGNTKMAFYVWRCVTK